MKFESNVFINCPFDDGYRSLLRPLLFTIIYLNLTPRITLEDQDSGQPRFNKIVSLIKESKYSIHDLSRIKATKKGEYFRLNMPFELGLDIGCRQYKGNKWCDKKCLILETEKYRYQAAISDLSNSDIKEHDNEPRTIVTIVRNWLNNEAGINAPGAARIWSRFNDFMADNYDFLIKNGFSKEETYQLPMNELMTYMIEWIAKHSSGQK